MRLIDRSFCGGRVAFVSNAALGAVVLCAAHVGAAPEYRGMSYTSFGPNVLLSSGSDQSIANMRQVGVDTVALNVWAFQDDQTATEIDLDFSRYSSTVASVEHAIGQIHAAGMRVLLKPNVDLRNGVWRARINPSTEWFAEYGSFINEWAALAERNGVALMSIGTEYNDTDAWADEWRAVAAGVRDHYSGPITYSADWNSYDTIEWWDAVDYVGIDAYFPLDNNGVNTPQQLAGAWENRANALEAWRNSNVPNQQVLFTEVGYRSADGAAAAPWGGVPAGAPVDLNEQAWAYDALLSTMWDRTWWDGAFWWDWTTNPVAGGPNDDGFTPQGKPAEAVVASYYGGTAIGPPVNPTSGGPIEGFENGLGDWEVVGFTNQPTSIGLASQNTTEGAASLAVTQQGSGFSWGPQMRLTGNAYQTLMGAVETGVEGYLLEFDVIYDPAVLPSDAVWMNGSMAINVDGDWSQVDGFAATDGRTDETIRVSIPLSDFSSLAAGAQNVNMVLAINGSWGSGPATVHYDNFHVFALSSLEGDYNGDGVVNAVDYAVWRDTVGSVIDRRADGNGDRVVGPSDRDAWRLAYGGEINASAVPEPCAWLMVAVLAALTTARARPVAP